MKKLLFILLTFLFAAPAVRAAYVDGNPKTTAASKSVCTGTTTVDIPITAASLGTDASVGIISLKLSYNTSQLSLDPDPNNWVVSGTLNSTINSWHDFLIGDGGTPGNIIISAYQPDGGFSALTLSDLSPAPDLVLLTLHFTIVSLPAGNTAQINFVDGGQGTSCEYDGAFPNYLPFTDTPTPYYYINGGVTMLAVPTLSINDVTVNENDGTATFTVTQSAAITCDVTFYAATADHSAIAGSDYTALPSTQYTITAGNTTKTISIPITDDNLVEPTEDFYVNLSSPVNATIADAQGVGTILDNDLSEVSIAATTPASEPNVNGLFTLTLTNPVSVSTTVTFAVTGTATEGTDYAAIGTTVVIPANTTSVTIPVTVINDLTVETGGETVIITLLSTNTAVTVAGTPNNAATITIADDDASVVSIAATTPASEPNVNGLFTLTLTNPVSVATTVSYSVGGTATPGVDYTALSGSVVIAANTTTATITVPVLDDNIVETGGETVIVTLLSTNTAVTVASSPNDAATVTIADDDASAVSIAATTPASEPNVNGLFTLTLTNPVSVSTTVTFAVTGTATEGTDYAAIGTTVVIPANTTSVTIPVTVINDLTVETGGETVIITLLSTNTAVTVAGTPNNAATITIADDDASVVSIAATTPASEPNVNGLFTLTLTNPVSVATTVSYSVGGTATPGVDYTALSGSVVIAANTTTATITVPVLDDNIVETGGETVIVTLLSTNTAVTVASSPNDAATVTISDDDASAVSIAATTPASEPNVNGLFTLTLTNPVSVSTTVTFAVTGTATEGTDYAAIGTTVVIPANTTSVTIPVTVINDLTVETGGETVIITLLSTNTAVTVAATPNNTATVTIADDDFSAVSIAATTQASEPSTNGLFTLTLTNPVSVATTVSYSVGGTATPGVDYTALSGSVVIAANTTTATITVPVLDDNIVETGGETVIVTLLSTNTAVTVASSPNDAATVTIADDDASAVSIAATTPASEPNVNGLFTLTLTNPVSVSTTVTFAVTGTATEGTDYAAIGTTVVIPANTTSVTIPVTVINDLTVETGGETVIITLLSTNTAVTVAGTPNNAATITIADDDASVVSIAATTPASEPNVNGLFTLTLTNPVSVATTVSYSVGGTATPGVDYTALSGSVVIAANTTTATITVPVLDDNIVETGGETVIVTLLSTNTAVTVASSPNDAATVTIADDDASAVSIAATTPASEPNVNGLFTLTLTNPVSVSTTVTFAVTGTATEGTDYAAIGTTVVIPANTTSVTIPVTVINDLTVETGGETVIITLLSTNTAVTVAGTPNNAATITIADDDASVVSIAATTPASEPNVNGLFTLTLTNPVSVATTVSYSVGGTATPGVDYTALSGSVVIAANTTTATITVPVLDDNIVETGGETVIVTLLSTNTAVTVASSPNDAATVTIADDDASAVSIAATTPASEPNVNGLFTLTLTNPVSVSTTVTFAVTGTATEGTDYAAIGTTVVIPANTTSVTIPVTVINDLTVETGGETVIITLLSTNTAVTVAGTPNNAATITIADDDASVVSIAATTPASEPNVNGLFTLTLTNPVSVSTTVTFAVTGTATEGTDYAAIGTTVVIPANTTTATITVPVLDDNIVETGGETVIVTLLSTNTAVTVASSPNDAATVTIADDDASAVSIAATTPASEPNVNGLFTLTLTNPVSVSTTVTFAVTGTATEGTDYAAIGTTVVIPANTTSVTIPVTVINDLTVETGGETVIITLLSTNTAVTVAGTPNNAATVTIADDDASVVSIAATTPASEPNVNGLFTLTLTNPVSVSTTVTYAVTGTATEGTDYAAIGTTVVIPANTTSVTIPVTVINDLTVETGGETVIITLLSTNTAVTVAGTPNNAATITIADDDASVVSIAATTPASEPNVNGLFTLTLTNPVSVSTTVTFAVTGTATEGTDYAAIGTTVVIPANTTSVTIPVTVINDLTVETGGETVIITLLSTNTAVTVASSPNDAATVTIADDDASEVSIAATTPASEPNVNGLFTLTLTNPVSVSTTVTFAVTGTATEGTDYAAIGTTVVIPANTTSVTIPVTVINDLTVETGGETVIITLLSTNTAVTVAGTPNNAATITIADDDASVVSIAATTPASEPNVNGLFTLTLTNPVSVATTVSYSVGGTATPGVDYTALSGSVVIAANTTTATITVPVLDDNIVETGGETVIVTLLSTNTAVTVASSPNDAATVTIADDDASAVSIAATTPASEPNVNGLFTLTLTNPVSVSTTVTFAVTGTATEGTDYAAIGTTVVIPANTTSVTIPVTVINDLTVETGGETVIITLLSTNTAVTVAGTPNNAATITIADDDASVVSIAATTPASEPNVNGLFTLTLTNPVSVATTVSYSVGGTATPGVDYTALSGSVVIAANTTTATITVPVLDDNIVETGGETVIVTLLSTNTAVTVASSPNDAATVTIADDDASAVSIAATTPASEPNVNGLFTLTLTNPVSVSTTVTFAVTGTATEGTDYAAIGTTVVIPANTTSVTIPVTVINDLTVETGGETVIITLLSTNTAVTVAGTPNNAATITIADDDASVVSIAATTPASEPNVNGLFTLTLTNPVSVATTVSYSVGGTATPGVDYTALSGSVVIAANTTTATITVPVLDDNIVETGGETVIVTLLSTNTAVTVASSPNDAATVTIADDDASAVSIAATTPASEPNVNGLFTLTLTNPVSVSTTVTFAVTGTATEGTDYAAIGTTVVIPANTTSVTIPVTVINDLTVETGGETVIITLLSTNTAVTVAGTPNNAATITIADDDASVVSIAATTPASEPNVNGLFTLTLTNPVSVATTVSYSVGGTATPGVDYTALSGSVVIAANTTTATITVPVLDDNIVETGGETVIVTLLSTNTAVTVASSPNDAATVTIADDDASAVSIAATTPASEPNVNGLFTLTLTNPVSVSTTVTFAVTGTATEGTDYAAIGTTVVIPANTTSVTIPVTVINDLTVETGGETVIITLLSTNTAVTVAGTPNNAATITIADDDASVVSIAATTPASEPNVNGLFTLTLTNPVSVATTVSYSVGGTATPGVDYTALSGSVVIAANTTTATITVPVLDDNIVETGGETVIVTLLSTNTAVTVASSPNDAATVTIADDDASAVSIAATTPASEPNVNGLFTLTLTNPVSVSTTVTFAVTGTATEGTDYAAIGTTVVIPANTTSVTIPVTVINDLTVETGGETVIITLLSTNTAVTVAGTPNNAATITIADDDASVVSIAATTPASEPNVNGLFTLTLTNPVSVATTVSYSVGGTATPGVDYTALSGSVVIAANTTTATITVPVLDDNIVETGGETVIVTLLSTNTAVTVASSPNDAATVTIADDDASAVSIAATTPASEPNVNGLFTLTLTNPVSVSTTVTFAVTGTATEGTDYAAIGTTVVIPANTTSVTIPVTVINDLTVETGGETVIITLLSTNTAVTVAGTPNNAATITIADDDASVVSIAATTPASEPNVNGLFTLTLTNPVSVATTVSYSVGGTATPGVDYTALSGSVVIAANTTTATITVPVLDDNIVETGGETVIVTLLSTNTAVTVASSPNDAATVTIADDDASAVSIAATTPASEPNVNGLFTLTLTNPVSVSTTVTFAVTGTATEGTDYAAIGTTVVIPANTTSVTIPVTVINDLTVETGGETVIITLLSTNTAVTVAGTPNNAATITIADDDASVVSIAATTPASEPNVNGLFTLTLTNPVSVATTVSYSVGGTATPGVDYTALSGSVVIAANTTTATITVPVLDDNIVETGGETVIVTLLSTNTAVTVASSPNDAATVTIADDDASAVSIAATTPASEPNVNGLFTLTLTNPVSVSTTVTFAVTGTATEGTDYAAIGTTVVIPANTTSVTIPVTVINDLTVETGGETVIITLLSTNTAVTVAGTPNNAATITIADDDASVVSIAATTPASEPNVNGLFTLTLTNPVSVATTVSYSVGGTATPGVDYTALSGSVVIAANTTTATITVPVLDDNIVETGGETVIVTLLSTNTAVTVASSPNDAATVTIADDDASAVSIAATTPASEPNVNGLFTLTLTNPVSVSTTVTFAVTGTATEGTDYAAIGTTVVIPANTTSVTIPVTVINDLTVETGGETVIITLLSTNTAVTVAGTPNNAATITIADDDASVVSIAATTPASEPNVNGLFTLTLTNPVSVATTVSYSVGGTATPGVDYTALSGSVVIAANTTTATITVPVLDDNIVETGGETVIVTLLSTNTAVTVASSPNDAATVTIADDDASAVSIAATTPASEPNVNGLFTLTLTNPVSVSTTVTFAVTGTATEGTDYAAIGTTVVIPANTTSVTIPVTVINDLTVETGGETVIITLLSTNTAVTVAGTPNNAATITIADDDASVVSIAATTPASEPNVNGLFTLTLTNPVSVATTVSYSVGGTATPGVDYTALSGSVVIAANTTTATITVPVLDDNIVETGGETVIVTLLSTNTAVTVASSPNDAATVTIADDDASAVSIAATTPASEPNVNGLFTLTLTNPVSVSTTVTFAVTGTATEGTDYAAIGTTVVIPANTTSVTIPVTVINDLTVETGGETVIITLLSTNTAVTVAGTPNNAATITIADDDASVVSIAATTPASEPNVNGLFTLTLTNPVSVATTVSYSVGGTATPGVDYTALSGSVVIAANTTTATITVPVLDDNIVETGGETVIVTLLSTNTAVTVASSPNDAATVTIADDDASAVSIAATTPASEPNVNGLFTLTLTNPVSVSTTVTFAVTGTATEGTDYAAIGTTVVIPANTTSVTIPVTVINDLTVETGGETVIITLLSTNTAVTVAATPNNTATVTIADDDFSAVSIAATTQASEPSTNGLFTLTLTNPVSIATTVSYSVDGTATPGVDYTALSGSVVIAANTTTATITVSVIDDNFTESNETVLLTLTSTNTAVTVGSPSSATVTINDNDASSVAINDITVVESQGPAIFTVTLTGAIQDQLTVQYATNPGTALVDDDYTTTSATMIFAAGSPTGTTHMISVPITNDAIPEVSETFDVNLSNLVSTGSASISDDQGVGTITDDDFLGNINYFNAGNANLEGVSVKLYQGASLKGSATTDGSGGFAFHDIIPGTYDIKATSTKSTVGAVNTTDAAQVNFWGANNSEIQKVRFHAGDVGTPVLPSNLMINSTDATLIQRNFVFGTAFDNLWTFWTTNSAIEHNPICGPGTPEPECSEYYPHVTMPVNAAAVNMYGLVTGDFNMSFNPLLSKSASATLTLTYSGNRQIGKNQEFDLPFRLVNPSSIGAVSLILNFPADLADVQGVTMNGSGGQLDWNVKGNELRIGWNSMSALNPGANEILLTLHLKTSDSFILGNSIRFTLAGDPLNELADASYNVIGDAVLSVEVIDGAAVGIEEQPPVSGFALGNHPNPFSNFTTITYSLPYDGNVSLQIRDLMGNTVKTLVNESQQKGDHALKFDAVNLPAGIYTATIRLSNNNDERTLTIKLVNYK